jgi:hypothetical protein
MADEDKEDQISEARRAAGFEEQRSGGQSGEALYSTTTLVRAAFVAACILAWIGTLAVLYLFGLLYALFPPTALLVYSFALVILTVVSFSNIRSDVHVTISAGIFTFSIISILTVWVGLGGILASLAPYYVLSYYELI